MSLKDLKIFFKALPYNGGSSRRAQFRGSSGENSELYVSKKPSWALGESKTFRFLDAAQSFNQVYTPLLCLFGTLGNCLSVTVFCRTSTHRSLSASFYLSALAISDTGFLFSLLAVWLEDMGVHVITSSLTCPLVMYLGQVTCFLSVWFIVAFTMERFFAVCYPLTRPTVCTVARAKKVIFSLTTAALVGFSYVWVIARVLEHPVERPFAATSTSSYEGNDLVLSENNQDAFEPHFILNSSHSRLGNGSASDPLTMVYTHILSSSPSPPLNYTTDYISLCSVRQEHVYFSSIASHIDSILTLILPFGIISYLNVRIAMCVWRLKDQREHLVAMAKITRQTGSNYGTGRTQVGFVYRSKYSGNRSPGRHVHNNTTHLNSTNPNNYRSKSNLTVDFEPSESSTSSSAHCCSDFSRRNLNSNNNRRRMRKRRANNSSSYAKAETRVTKTLLLVSTVFLVLNLPSHAIRATTFIQSFWKINIEQEALFAAQLWANILFNMNFSVNFLLYCVSGRNFRLSVKNIFCRRKRAPRYPKNKPVGSPSTTYGQHSPREFHSPSHRRESCYPASVTEMETYA
ncbi:unnamed protein product [Allacma fusca]|uniref:G-protein coupled receptors family 1 profile domain-containing protein n=1 Tax=Allacma fusca TaxID=39272 RepID=A0A8J2P2Q5_9HEXA|nr:unnamed protein product [Allacma fusca]